MPLFSGRSAIYGSPGGDQWARVLRGQFDRLSLPLQRVDADCSESTNLEMKSHGKHEKIAAPKTHHEIHTSPATAATSRRRATKHVPRVSSYSPAAIDLRFVEIGLVQLSQITKTANVTQTDRKTDRQTDRQIDRQTGRQKDRQTERQTDRPTYRRSNPVRTAA